MNREFKVVCVSNMFFEKTLTVGKEYIATSRGLNFLVDDDYGNCNSFSNTMFRVVKEPFKKPIEKSDNWI